MKVMLLNGSPRAGGNTRLALEECARTLADCGVDAEIVDIGPGAVAGCTAWGACGRLGRCVIDDGVNAFSEKMAAADGLIVGQPRVLRLATARSSPSSTGCFTPRRTASATSRPPPWPSPAAPAR